MAKRTPLLTQEEADAISRQVRETYTHMHRGLFPEFKTNKGVEVGLAQRMYVVSMVRSLCDIEYKSLLKTCAKLGMITDKENDPKPAGTVRNEYEDHCLRINLEVREASKALDKNKLRHAMKAAKIAEDKIEAILAAGEVTYRPGHVFTTTIRTDTSIDI